MKYEGLEINSKEQGFLKELAAIIDANKPVNETLQYFVSYSDSDNGNITELAVFHAPNFNSIPKSILLLKKLVFLKIVGTKLKELPIFLTELEFLEDIVLIDNPLSEIPKSHPIINHLIQNRKKFYEDYDEEDWEYDLKKIKDEEYPVRFIEQEMETFEFLYPDVKICGIWFFPYQQPHIFCDPDPSTWYFGITQGDKGFYEFRIDLILRYFAKKRKKLFQNAPTYEETVIFSDEEKGIALNMFCRELGSKKWDVFQFLFDLEARYVKLPRISYVLFQFFMISISNFTHHYLSYINSLQNNSEIDIITKNRFIGIYLLALLGGNYFAEEYRYGEIAEKGFDSKHYLEYNKFLDEYVKHQKLVLREIHDMFYYYDIWVYDEFFKIFSELRKSGLSLDMFTTVPGVSLLLPLIPASYVTIDEQSFDIDDPCVHDFLLRHPNSLGYKNFEKLFKCGWDIHRRLALTKWKKAHPEEETPFYTLMGLPEVEENFLKMIFAGRNPVFYVDEEEIYSKKKPSEGLLLEDNHVTTLYLRRNPSSISKSVVKLSKLREIKFLPQKKEEDNYDIDPFFKEADFVVGELQSLPDYLEPYLNFGDFSDGLSNISIFESERKHLMKFPVDEGITEGIYHADVGDIIQEFQFRVDEGHVSYLQLKFKDLDELREVETDIQALTHLTELSIEFEEKVESDELPNWLKKLAGKIHAEIYSHGEYI